MLSDFEMERQFDKELQNAFQFFYPIVELNSFSIEVTSNRIKVKLENEDKSFKRYVDFKKWFKKQNEYTPLLLKQTRNEFKNQKSITKYEKSHQDNRHYQW